MSNTEQQLLFKNNLEKYLKIALGGNCQELPPQSLVKLGTQVAEQIVKQVEEKEEIKTK